ncbi:YqaA family protein [Ruania alba]|uniref:Membrane protein YqaA, SNARE-associated domain n=1 Tax=Ruania alba TaxID=648782 RepID=A0A1H5EBF1_9MICO|nr:VTT domain-containing protein [Ruania alba]SED88284.1 membrane protein YqaA, SNARE-associated domain [Ruania alba]
MDLWALAAALGYCALSAVVMVLPAEVYLLGAALVADVPPVWLAAAGATGQVAGKMLSYLVGRGVLDVARWRAKPNARWADRIRTVEQWCAAHTWGPSAVTLVSAFAGLPPYALVAVLAGTLRMRWWLFAGLSLIGRFLRFWAVVAVPELLPGTLFGI